MKPEKVVCANCVFWSYEWGIEDDRTGACKRYPKEMFAGCRAWCGEWSDTWPAGWIEYEEPTEPETVEVFQFLGGGSLQK